MIRGFRDVNGVPVPFAEIDYVRDAARFNCSPATLAMLIDSVRARDGVDFSASQLSTTPRQHFLRAHDYYPTTAQAISGHMGTIKHQQVNVQRDRLIVEQRFTSKRDPRISGQIDSAAIIELTDDGTLVVDLYDLKSVKWYSAMLIAKNVWMYHPDYAWQLNLCAALMEEASISTLVAICGLLVSAKRGNLMERLRVRNLYLECIPADGTYKHQEEAAKLGVPEYQKLIIPVERKSADETYAVYAEALTVRDAAVAAESVPLCEDTWSNKTISHLRCRHYCDVRDECIAFQHASGEAHPIAPLTAALEASFIREVANE